VALDTGALVRRDQVGLQQGGERIGKRCSHDGSGKILYGILTESIISDGKQFAEEGNLPLALPSAGF